MSGGVDSTVTAYLLKKEGHDVVGVNFNFVGASTDPELLEIAEKLDIKILYRDYSKEFYDKIIKYFVTEYENGRTPNPCAICNPTMKFEKLLQVMREENCDMVATGHYANIAIVGADNNVAVGEDIIRPPVGANACRAHVGDDILSSRRYCIKKSNNQQKDQSYMLYRLSQDQLSHIMFPLSDMDKNEVRKIAAEIGLKVAEKKDSQDVCFISNSIDYKEFIKRYEFGNDYREKIARGQLKEEDILSKPYFKRGEFVDLSGKVLGFHDGIINYTVGQRKGFNIAFGERKFAVKIDAEKNQVVLGSNDDLMASEFKIKDVVFSGHDENIIGKKFYAKLRYRHDGTLCEIIGSEQDESGNLILSCHLTSPVRAITPGQSAVFYDEQGRVMLGGIIL